MNRNETIKILLILSSNYPSIDRQLQDKQKSSLVVETWQSCLEDISYQQVLIAVKKTIINSTYPPTIHDIRNACVDLSEHEEKTAIEYWDEAFKMIKKGTYMTKEEFESHSEVVKKFFGDVAQVKELAMTDYQTVSTVTKGQFLKQVEMIQKRKKENDMLPEKLKEEFLKLTGIKQIE